MTQVRIERVEHVSPSAGDGVRRLLGQLSTRSPAPDDTVLSPLD